MTGEALVSVVIPVYNRASLLQRALDSVKKQTLLPNEIIVVDDGSTQGSLDRVKDSHNDVKWLRQENAGVAAARNSGIKECKYEWIALLDSDDEWTPQKLECQIHHIRANRDCRAVHTEEKWIRNGNEVLPPQYLNKEPDRLWERSLHHCLICPSSALLHKSVFEQIGRFNEALLTCEDYDFWLRMLLEIPIGLVKKKLVIKHGGHADQLSTTTWGMDRFRVQALIKLSNRQDLDPSRREKLREVISKKSKILEQGARKRNKLDQAEQYANLHKQYSTQRRYLTVLTKR